MRAHGPPPADGAKRAKPLLLSAVTRRGMTDVLRATMAAIEARRAEATPGGTRNEGASLARAPLLGYSKGDRRSSVPQKTGRGG